MKRLQKIAGFFIFLTIVGVTRPALAEAPQTSPKYTPTYNNSSVQTNTQTANTPLDAIYENVDPDVPRNISTLTQSTFLSVLTSASCILGGKNPIDPTGKCLGFNIKTGKIGYVDQNGGMPLFMGRMIGGTMNLPISGSQYTQYAMNNFGISKHAYAATDDGSNGIGYSRLTPLVGVWSKFRDIAYLAFIIAFTVIGLAIMFRVKIDARTVMTIQNQIPKIVIALVLVTFSYAIAGFLIDMMYVLMYLILLMFSSLTPVHVNTSSSVFSVVNKAYSPHAYDPGYAGIMSLTIQMSTAVSGVFSALTTDFINSSVSSLARVPFVPFSVLDLGCEIFGGLAIPGSILGKIPGVGDLLQGLPGPIGSFFGSSTPACNFAQTFFELAVGALFGLITFLVVLIAIIYTLFRVWFTLIKSYAYVLLDAMIGPLWIGAGIFPGSKLGFGTWVRHLAAHLSVFPMTFAVILLGKTIMDAVGAGKGDLFAPPLVGDAFSGNAALASFIGFAFIISLPSILEKTRKTIGAIDFGLVDVKKAFNASNPLAAAQQGSQLGGTLFGLSHIPAVNKLPFIRNVTAAGHSNVRDDSVGGSGGSSSH